MSRINMLRKGDIIIFVSIIAIIGLFFGAGRMLSGGYAQEKRVIIELDGEIIKDMDFPSESERMIVELPEGDAVLEFSEGRVRVVPMPLELCPLGICSSVGWIERPRQTIVCLPNRLIVTILGYDYDELDLDGVTD